MSKFFDNFKNQINSIEKVINDYTGHAKSTSNPSFSYVEWASALIEEGKEDDAISKLETATQMAVKNPEACVNLAMAYIKRDSFDKVPPLLNKAIKIDSQYARAYLAYGIYYSSVKDYEKAEHYYEIAAKLDSRLPDVYVNWAVSLVNQGKNREAQEKFQKAQFYNPNNLMGLYLWAVLDIDMGDYVSAKKKLSIVLSFQPDNPEALFSMALAYYKIKNYAMSVEFAQNALQNNNTNPKIYALLADSYCCMNNYEKAMEIYKEGDKKQFDSENFYLSFGERALRFKDYENSLYAYNKALKINPDSTWAKNGLATNYLNLNKLEEAKSLLLEILDKTDNNIPFYIKLASAENSLKNYKSAIEYILLAIKGNVKNTELYYDLGILYEKINESDKAKDAYAKMLEYHKDNMESCYRYAKLSLKDNPKDALRKIRTAYNSDKKNYDYMKLYVQVLLVNGMYKSAQDVIEKGLNDYSNNTDLIYLKIRILLNINKYNESIELLYGLPQDKKENEDFDYLLLWAYILRALGTNDNNDINEKNDFSYYLSQKYGKNPDFMVKLKTLEDKYKQKD